MARLWLCTHMVIKWSEHLTFQLKSLSSNSQKITMTGWMKSTKTTTVTVLIQLRMSNFQVSFTQLCKTCYLTDLSHHRKLICSSLEFRQIDAFWKGLSTAKLMDTTWLFSKMVLLEQQHQITGEPKDLTLTLQLDHVEIAAKPNTQIGWSRSTLDTKVVQNPWTHWNICGRQVSIFWAVLPKSTIILKDNDFWIFTYKIVKINLLS